uniref:Uncharacterized protein n=1 Tax=Pipistrellus kuhlii TaxID=59472 RepID=A0A7J7XBQ1_PIPKU|nr:hypothetical protein mPipKuh1_010662 [Pipistrellus kuhlii]
MPRTSQLPPLEEPTAFPDSPRAPLCAMAMATGMRYLPSIKFFMIFKCLSKLQTSGPCPPSPPTLGPQGKACGCCPGSQLLQAEQLSLPPPPKHTHTPHRAGLSLLCCCFRVFLSMGSWSWFRENVEGLLSNGCSC